MAIIRLLFLCFIASWPLLLPAKQVPRVTLVRYTEEKINGKLFTHRVDITNGKVSDRWAIDAKEVNQAEYEEAIVEAEKAERKLERKQAEAARRKAELEQAKQQEFTHVARIAIHKKCLASIIADTEVELDKIKDRRLSPYLHYEPSTFESAEAFEHFENQALVSAQRIIEQEDLRIEEERISNLIAQLEPMPGKLRDFFRASVKNAINTCNDTRLLKEFLEIIV